MTDIRSCEYTAVPETWPPSGDSACRCTSLRQETEEQLWEALLTLSGDRQLGHRGTVVLNDFPLTVDSFV